ncbi:type I-B CRISPR-associated protein Cas5b [Anaerostipes sp.]|uniref:type I-B CRISPR-associated protein Cas5b n=1 Tax=Anaerostipes sp. TaxID=1872530 RepID=UPI0025BABCBA|nr:type I-B CRISPR-associated protein Cas5b [Anaerostipes sp.]MBS7007946.1 type I-B CRISPR-associated protein Cas5 [Anaerostipes sp.]
MDVCKITLKGRTAFFKKPDVNSYYYFTYGQIHKIVLLGIFGAVLGYSGYESIKTENQKKDLKIEPGFPEFYERLKDCRFSIVPKNEKGWIPKKIQYFNNSVGYASKEQGGNLIVKEQWLESPEWDIYILLDCGESRILSEALLDFRCVYSPYLGKNDHPADLVNPQILTLEEISTENRQLDCFVPKSKVTFAYLDEDDEEEEDFYKYEEGLPYALDPYTNLYITEPFVFTNQYVKECGLPLYRAGKHIIAFY